MDLLDRLRPYQISAAQRIMYAGRTFTHEITELMAASYRGRGIMRFLTESQTHKIERTARTEIERLVMMAYIAGVEHVCDTAMRYSAECLHVGRGPERTSYRIIAGMKWDSPVREMRERVKKLDLMVTEKI